MGFIAGTGLGNTRIEHPNVVRCQCCLQDTKRHVEAIERVAHTLKGELGYLGISEVSRKAREMEEFGQKSDVRLAASLYATFEPELCELLISMRRMVGAKPGVEMVAGRPEAGQ